MCVTESLDVLTPPSHSFSCIAVRNISIPPKQWDLIEPPTGHGQPLLSLLPDPLNSSSATRFPPPHPFTNHVRHQHSPLFYPSPSDGSTLPRNRRHEESSEHDSRLTASTGPKVMCVEDHHLRSLFIPRHPSYLNEYDLILPSMPPLPIRLSRPSGNCDIPPHRRADTRPSV